MILIRHTDTDKPTLNNASCLYKITHLQIQIHYLYIYKKGKNTLPRDLILSQFILKRFVYDFC